MKKRILIADDETAVAKILRDRFVHWGYEVETASDGEKTLEKVKSFKPHLLLLDLKMPKIGGMDVLERTKKAHPQIGVLVLTASQSKDTHRNCLEKGADGYMLKPFKTKTIKEYIEKILKTRGEDNIYD